jgi:hypothetical protein
MPLLRLAKSALGNASSSSTTDGFTSLSNKAFSQDCRTHRTLVTRSLVRRCLRAAVEFGTFAMTRCGGLEWLRGLAPESIAVNV